jgi:hypothetical protein
LEWREAELADRSDASRELRLMVDSDPDPAGSAIDLRRGIRLDAPKIHPRADAETVDRPLAMSNEPVRGISRSEPEPPGATAPSLDST